MRRGGWLVVLALVAGCTGGDGGVFDTPGGWGPTAVPGDTGTTTTMPGETTTTVLAVGGMGVVEVADPDPAATVAGPDGSLMAGDQVLVILAEGFGDAEAQAAAAAVGGQVVGRIELIGLWQIAIPPTSAEGVASAVAAAGAAAGVESAFPNGTAGTEEEVWGVRQSPLNDPAYQGRAGAGYRMIGVERAWAYLRASGLPSQPVHVGIVDSGVWRGNGEFDGVEMNDLGGVLAAPAQVYGFDPVDGGWVAEGDDERGGHGTGVANLLGADGGDGGVAGIAGVIDQLRVSVSNPFVGEGRPPRIYLTAAMRAIVEQINAGARVINMSWGCSKANPAQAATFRGFFEEMARLHPEVLFVAAALNDGWVQNGERAWPGGLNRPNMITVGNVRNDGATAPSSNRASPTFEVTLAAPGSEAVQAVGPDGTIINTGGGTSMAAPQVTAAAALLLSIRPDLTAAQIKQLLSETARTQITRDDGTIQPIDPGVGGRVLAVDQAVRRLITEEREARGLQPAALTDEYLAQLSVVDAVAVSGEGSEWTVRGIVTACHPDGTDLTIAVSAPNGVAGETHQHLAAAGEVTWIVSVDDYPATILLTRTDNGAASLITLDRPVIDGHYTGTFTVETIVTPPDLAELGMVLTPGAIATFDLDLTANTTGGGEALITLYWEGAAVATLPAPLTWDGTQLEINLHSEGAINEDTQYLGTASRTGDTVTITGTWSSCCYSSPAGSWQATRTG